MHADQTQNDGLPKRKFIRWQGYDYTSCGLYFITMVAYHRQHLFGHITDGKMMPSDIGRMVQQCIETLSCRFSEVEIDDWVVMPNHLHLIITNEGNTYVPEIIRQLKAMTSYQYHKLTPNTAGSSLWQRNYYDRVIRDEREYNFVRNYIFCNPERWEQDQLNNLSQATDFDDIGLMLHQIQLRKDFNPTDYFKRK